MAVLPIGTAATAFVPGASGMSGVSAVRSPAAATAPDGSSFGQMLSKGIDSVTSAQDKASALSGQLATGQLTDIHEFTTAAAKASLAVSLTANVRNRAVEAYQEIMRMQV